MSWVQNAGALSDREYLLRLATRLEARCFGFKYDAERLRLLANELDDMCDYDHDLEAQAASEPKVRA